MASSSNRESNRATVPLSRRALSVVRWLSLLLLASVWVSFTSVEQKAVSVIAALGYSCIEYSWYSMTTELPDGNVKFTPFASTCRNGHTTFAQYWANVLYLPILLFHYRSLISNPGLRIVLFPFNIWLLEIVEGYFLIFFYGSNIAWSYTGWDALFSGNIKLGFFHLWLGMGFLVEILATVYFSFTSP